MLVLILRIASAAPEKTRAFYKVLLKLEQALSGSIKSQHPHFNPKVPGLSNLSVLEMHGREPAGPMSLHL